ncbi:MAG: magnesium chelatase [Cryomorphaceae bacterium MED-G14]|nr:MAG: magnesium chelatase [Cryomorphaceae bacterium MED-G14]|tara:strand:- start:1039 stop:2502 length:1464 start_codon:yes stop_codon:yes gene_type:complete
MKKPVYSTIKELKKINYKSKSIKDELSDNLSNLLKNGKPSFFGIYGYENTVIPDLERAILSKHNINFLGLRGQAKTRLARKMVDLLDEWIPVVDGSEINDDPLDPISNYAKKIINDNGDDTKINWIHRSERFYEKLATPDVTVSDLIGDIDPIKAASLKLSYSDERVIHFGMIPRANRSIFIINELPDLQARIQVALFSILEEKEIQIRGFKLRLPLDLQFIFTANPEDYTNRGSIVTPLKDRIGSQIITHYPLSIEISKKITNQEANSSAPNIYVPEIAKDLVEEINFAARKSDYVDYKSGVSARMSITAFENLVSTTRRRMLINGEDNSVIRLSDFAGIIPAINGKIELVYEGEEQGADQISYDLINEGVKSIFIKYFPEIKKLQKQDEVSPYDETVEWFLVNENEIFIGDEFTNVEYEKVLNSVKPLDNLIDKYCNNQKKQDLLFFKELLLWGMSAFKKLEKNRMLDGLEFKDSIGTYFNDINT